MQQNGTMTQQKTTIAQKTAMAASVALFFATPVIILLRRKSGYRFLNPMRFFFMVLVLFFWAMTAFLSGSAAAYSSASVSMYSGQSIDVQSIAAQQMAGYVSGVAIIIFAIVVLAAGMLQRFLRWNDIKKGIPWHTYSRGVSLFSFLPFADNKIKRFVDPLVCIIVGLVALLVKLNYLSYYLLFAGACLFIFEAWDYDQALNQSLDMLDSLVESEVVSSNVEYYSQPNPTQRPLEQTAGIPTGIAPDIQHQIERRQRNRPALPNDLVITTPVQGPAGTAMQP